MDGRASATHSTTDRSVVVPAIVVPSSVACLRSLRRHEIGTIAISERPSPPAFTSRYCDEAYSVPDPAEDLDGYRDAMVQLAMRTDVDTILPVREEDVFVLARNRERFGEFIGTPWPDLETLERVHDRVALFETAENAGVSAPETQLLTTSNAWDREWIVKSRYAIVNGLYTDSHPRDQCRDPPGTTYLAPGEPPAVDELVASMGHVPLLQEYVPTTDEYGFFAIYDEGDALATFQHRQRRGYSYAGGASAYRESVAVPALERAGRAILDALEWHGVAMVEFLRHPETGEFLLMEINPRFWSSLPFSIRAGADFPYYSWALAVGEQDRIDPGYEVGLAGHLIRGELLHLRSVVTEENPLVERPALTTAIRDVAGSMIRHPRFDYLVRDDPWPFVRDMELALRESVRGLRPGSRSGGDKSPDDRYSEADHLFDEFDRDAVVRLETSGQTDNDYGGNPADEQEPNQ